MSPNKKRYHLKTRLLLVISLLIFGSVVLVSTVGFVRYSDDLLRQTATQTQQLLEQIALNTGNYINDLSRLCMSPYYSERIMGLLASSPTDPAETLDKRRAIENYLREVMTIPRKDILRVYILTDEIYYSTRTAHPIDLPTDYQKESWYQSALDTASTVFLPAHVEINNGYTLTVFSMVQRLRSLSDSSKTLGVIRVDANYSGIRDVLDDVQLLEKSGLFIIDNANSVVYQHSTLPGGLPLADVFSSAKTGESPTRLHLDGETYIINSQPVKDTDWTIIAVNAQSSLMKDVASARQFTVLLAFVCALVGLLVTILFVRSFIKPINNTVAVMRTAQHGDLSVRASEHRAEEIDYLNRSFNELLLRISEMIEHDAELTREKYEAEYLQKIAQYDALYNQIRPHFLFNTLSTVSLLVKSGRYPDAIASIDELSILLRGMVNTDRDITITAELKIAECYLSLQERRHDELTYQIQLDPALADCRIPALTVQPIVENALIHGCEPRIGSSHISISVQAEGEDAVICVSDNGIGMEQSQLDTLNQAILDRAQSPLHAETRSVGLVNIAQRLKLKYGARTQITISSTRDVGTSVTIRIPKECEKSAAGIPRSAAQ
ncbi:MAG TPA: sensor histidine kinase [Clostridia bacterium]|nr:sensor histidine kinase [Clostridia bacterium]